jgi:putative membrane protein
MLLAVVDKRLGSAGPDLPARARPATFRAMSLRWLLAFLHLLPLPIGLAAVFLRARSLRAVARGGTAAAAVSADMWWGIAAFIWISTGLVRWLAGIEKPMPYYTHNWLFHAKLTALLVILILEVRPIIVISRWRTRLRRQQSFDTSAANAMATTSYIQLALALFMMIAATGMARGIGVFE